MKREKKKSQMRIDTGAWGGVQVMRLKKRTFKKPFGG